MKTKFFPRKGHYTRRHGATHLEVTLGSIAELAGRLNGLNKVERDNAIGLMRQLNHPQLAEIEAIFS